MWIVYAMTAAVAFGLRGVLYHWTSQRGLDRNLMLCGVFFTGMIVALFASLISGQEWTWPALIGIGMGAFSFGSNSSLYKGFAVGKASLIAILTGMPPAVVVILAYFIWGETLNFWQWIAFGALLVSIIMIRYSNDLSLKNLQGVQWGLLAMFLFAFTDLMSKQSTISGAEPFPTLFFMFLTGTVLFGLSWAASRRAAAVRAGAAAAEIAAARDSAERASGAWNGWSNRKTFLWGMLVGLTNAWGMIFMLEAFAIGTTGLVSAVAAMNILIILAYSRIVVKIPFKRLEVAGMTLAVAGMLLLRIAG